MKSEWFIVKGIEYFESSRVLLKCLDVLRDADGEMQRPLRVEKEEDPYGNMDENWMLEGYSTTGFMLSEKEDDTLCIELPCWASKDDVFFCFTFLKNIRNVYKHCEICAEDGTPVLFAKNLEEEAWTRREQHALDVLRADDLCAIKGCNRDFYLDPSRYRELPPEEQLSKLWEDFAHVQHTAVKHARTYYEECPSEYRHITDGEVQSEVKILTAATSVFVGFCSCIGLLEDNCCKFISHNEFFRITEGNKYINRLDAFQFTVDAMPENEWKELFAKAQGVCWKNYRKTFIMRWNTDISNHTLEDFRNCIRRFQDNPEELSYNWSIWDHAQAEVGDCFYMVRTGEGRNGIVMKGHFTGRPYTGEDWSRRGRKVYYIDMKIEQIIDPEHAPLLVTTEELEKALPDFSWQDGHSGELLKPEAAQMLEKMWHSYVVKAAEAEVKMLKRCKYYGNYMDDVVVREDENGRRFKKHQEDLQEYGPCKETDKEAFGGESFGFFHDLKPITQEEYETYGKTWVYTCSGSKRDICSSRKEK